MGDPLGRVTDTRLRAQLERIRSWDGEIQTTAALQSLIQGFQGQKGIYKPAGSEHALWIRQTLRGVYPDQEPNTHPDGSWTYRYAPEGRAGQPDLDLPTNRGLLKCKEDGIPVGVFRQKPDLGARGGYEVLGLAYVEEFDGTHFVLRGEAIDWTSTPVPENIVPTFVPFEMGTSATAEVSRVIRDQRFGVAVRRIYHERCSLCDVGFRLRGRSLALDAAHIIPVENHGIIGDVRNGLLLCKNHHALFDGFAWTMDDDLRVIVSSDPDFRRSATANHVLKFENQRLSNLPTLTEDFPATDAIRWRTAEFERRQD